MENFKQNLWLIELLTTEVMIKKPMYWKEVFAKCEINPIEPNDDMSLKVLLILSDSNRHGNVQPS
jgi:hypothetical protein